MWKWCSAPSPPASFTTAPAHCPSSYKQTSRVTGCVKLCSLCHLPLHLVWLSLNDSVILRELFSHLLPQFMPVCLYFSLNCWLPDSVGKLCSSVSFLNLIGGTTKHYFVVTATFLVQWKMYVSFENEFKFYFLFVLSVATCWLFLRLVKHNKVQWSLLQTFCVLSHTWPDKCKMFSLFVTVHAVNIQTCWCECVKSEVL